ncbi:MAG TPA: hypothetical protein VKS82_12910 [Streptosporangiaceae bacterium]|nr:hypothetical protein [Streptosporangiaceae bacterium]
MTGWIVVGFMAVAVLDAGYVAGKLAGLALAGTVLALVGLLTARTAIPSGRRKTRAEAEQQQADVAASQADFPAFLEISSDVTWATVSQRHFDRGIRPRLARLLDTRLAERHGVTIASQPDRARELAGEDLWPLIDPARPLSEDSNAPGVSLAKLTRIITRLEEL